jgi:hypothetical protein
MSVQPIPEGYPSLTPFLVDPFGQRWAAMTRVEQVDAEERDRRLAQWAKENV